MPTITAKNGTQGLHGICSTQKDEVSEDMLAFIKG